MWRAKRLQKLALAGLAGVLAACGPAAWADDVAAPAPAAERPAPAEAPPAPELATGADPARGSDPGRVGVGWIAGNGFGLLGGEVSVLVARQVGVGVHVAYARNDTYDETVYGCTPIVRAYLDADGPTFYGAAGVSLAWKSSDVTQGAFRGGRLSWVSYALVANVGYEWRAPAGIAMFVGAGVGWMPARTITNGVDTFHEDGYRGLNVEAGVRFLLF